ncbi:hypothetical protein ACFX13_030241 [Malus domestica]
MVKVPVSLTYTAEDNIDVPRKRFVKLAKSPISPPLAFHFNITPSGISFLSDDGIELTRPEICIIHCQGLLLRLLVRFQ